MKLGKETCKLRSDISVLTINRNLESDPYKTLQWKKTEVLQWSTCIYLKPQKGFVHDLWAAFQKKKKEHILWDIQLQQRLKQSKCSSMIIHRWGLMSCWVCAVTKGQKQDHILTLRCTAIYACSRAKSKLWDKNETFN